MHGVNQMDGSDSGTQLALALYVFKVRSKTSLSTALNNEHDFH